MIKIIKNENSRVPALLIFYENTRLLIYKLMGAVVYCILDHYVCIDYLCLQKEKKLSMSRTIFEDTSYDENSVKFNS